MDSLSKERCFRGNKYLDVHWDFYAGNKYLDMHWDFYADACEGKGTVL